MTTDPVSRRRFFGVAGAAAAAGAVVAEPLSAGAQAPVRAMPTPVVAPAPVSTASPSGVLLHLTREEAAFLRAAVERLFPADGHGPGALDLGVVDYIDRQLAGAHGAGDRLYLTGPWTEGTPQQGYQLPFTPARLYREALAEIMPAVAERNGGTAFEDLPGEAQDRVLAELERGTFPTRAVPSAVFFETLLANTIEGVFSDPIHGGNRDMGAWRMIGFPGAYAQFAQFVDQHGMLFDRAPMGIAETVHGHSHGLGADHAAPSGSTANGN